MGEGGASSGEGQSGDFPACGHHSANGFSGAQWATVSWASATAQHDSRGGVKVTAEECLPRTRSLSLALFAMVSSDCHVRNARAGTTGTWNVTLCDEFSRRKLESPLVCGPHPRSPHISDIVGAVRKTKKKTTQQR